MDQQSQRYHLSEDTDKGYGPCFAASEASCPKKGAPHFGSEAEAKAAVAYKNEKAHGVFKLFRKRKPKVEKTAPVTVVDSTPQSPPEPVRAVFDESAREARQHGGTAYHELLTLAPEDEIDELAREELREFGGSIGYRAANDGDVPVIGVRYRNMETEEETQALNFVRENLQNGTYGPDDVISLERDGRYILAFKGVNPAFFGDGSPIDPVYVAENQTAEHRDEALMDAQMDRRIELEELSEEEIDKIAVIPDYLVGLTKQQKITIILRDESRDTPEHLSFAATANGNVFTMVSNNPIEGRMFEKIAEAHRAGTLRMGESDEEEPAILFYDERDVSSQRMRDDRRVAQVHREIAPYVQETRDKIARRRGRADLFSPIVTSESTAESVRYQFTWNAPGSPRISGIFTAPEVDRIISGDVAFMNKYLAENPPA